MYTLLRNLNELSVEFNPSSPVFCDTETCEDEGFSKGGLYGKVRLFQAYQKHWDKAILFDCFFIPLNDVLNIFKKFELVFHNGSYDLHTINLKTKEMWLPKKIDDTLYLARLEWYTKTKFSFYDCLDYASLSDSLISGIDKKEQQKSDWSGALSLTQKLYAAADVVYLEKLFNHLKHNTNRTIYELDIKNLELAVQYSRNGMPINQNTVLKLKKEYINKLETVMESLPINPRSSKQSCEYLGTTSSAAEVLQELVYDGNTKAKQIQDARHCLKSLEYLNSYDRPVVKGFFQPCASLSGRFACTGGDSYNHVNLQQMPEKLHSVVEAPKGYSIIYKDYSGLELRMAVAYTGEPTMANLMRSGKDMHTETAKYVFSKNEVSDLERTIAKVFNFGLIYGAGISTIQNTLKLWANIRMPFNDVKVLIKKWFNMYEYFTEWHKIHKHLLNVYGYVDIETALGRKVRTYKLTDSLNAPIQGSSAEVTKTSLGLLYSRYPDTHLINTIHDSNILLARTDEAETWGTRLNECMIDAWNYVISELADPDIPMPDGFESGPIWIFH